MFGEAGHAYVYFTMGLHHCLNITTESTGTPGAVLIRALEPNKGLDEMMRNRGVKDALRIANGPGNLTLVMMIDRSFEGDDLVSSSSALHRKGQEDRQDRYQEKSGDKQRNYSHVALLRR